jgi:hypothetical protein
MNQSKAEIFEGGCTCGHVRYRMESRPMIVHCCHCRWCQRETGTAFALNAAIESDRLTVLDGQPETVAIPSESGAGQEIVRCPHCKIAMWSHYSSAGRLASMVRVGTLDDPDRLPPDVHIFTESKQPWVSLSPELPAFEKFYKRSDLWPEDSLKRRKAMFDAAS